ncbi:hypothetical protein SSX86_008889 [Deinandra increscens subsp. villosa]|uniref:Uncharacterized protein n=1 Tax=Deinandra increscens subsp. villosa TaxID=3103831 RepID=A0AAP0DG42_9ASTR
MTKQITYWSETPLLIAVGTGHSHRFVEKLMKRIVDIGAKEKLFVNSSNGSNALHYAAKVGNTTAARLLVEQNPDMTRVMNSFGNTPLKLAAYHGNKETLKYLLTVTPDLRPGEEGRSSYTGVDGGDLVTLAITAGFYDVALDIIDLYPEIVLEYDRNDQTALQVLALKPDPFPSGNILGFWGRVIYSSPTIKNIHDLKVNDNLTRLLVKRICKTVIGKADHDIIWKILGSAITTAVQYEAYELIEECIVTYPSIIWYDVGGFYLFHAAIKHRQERVYNLVYQMSGHKVFMATHIDENIANVFRNSYFRIPRN